MTRSFVSIASILLMSVAIFASVATDDSIDKSPLLEAMDCEFLGFLGLAPTGWFSQIDLQRDPILDFLFLQESPLTHCFQQCFHLIVQSIIENLALPQFLYTMVRVLCQEVFESLKVSPKRLVGFFFELHEVFSNQRSFVNRVEFLREDLDKILPRGDRVYSQAVQPFLC